VPDDPLRSSLLLARDRELTLADLLTRRLDETRLVVLSACQTALPGVEVLDEVVSLPAGLLQTGAAAAIGSLWSVDDLATMLLLRHFYELWRSHGLSLAEALRGAGDWLRNLTRTQRDAAFPKAAFPTLDFSHSGEPGDHPYAHPYWWAGWDTMDDETTFNTTALVLEAARAIRPYLQSLVGEEAARLDAALDDLLAHPDQAGVDDAILDLLEPQETTRAWISGFWRAGGLPPEVVARMTKNGDVAATEQKVRLAIAMSAPSTPVIPRIVWTDPSPYQTAPSTTFRSCQRLSRSPRPRRPSRKDDRRCSRLGSEVWVLSSPRTGPDGRSRLPCCSG
jgi:hypothetical protein